MAIKTKTVARPQLNFWQQIYVPEIIRGVMITGRHFWKNLFFHTMHALGLFKAIRAGVTIMYPEEKRKPPARLRTRHRLTKRHDGSPRCVACMMCETVCPAKCITIVAEEHPDVNMGNVFSADFAWKPVRKTRFAWTRKFWIWRLTRAKP